MSKLVCNDFRAVINVEKHVIDIAGFLRAGCYLIVFDRHPYIYAEGYCDLVHTGTGIFITHNVLKLPALPLTMVRSSEIFTFTL